LEKQLLDAFLGKNPFFQKMTFFIFESLIFQERFCKRLKKIFSTKFKKFYISAFIRTFNCQKISKIGSSNLKRSFCKSGPFLQNMGKKKPPPLKYNYMGENNFFVEVGNFILAKIHGKQTK